MFELIIQFALWSAFVQPNVTAPTHGHGGTTTNALGQSIGPSDSQHGHDGGLEPHLLAASAAAAAGNIFVTPATPAVTAPSSLREAGNAATSIVLRSTDAVPPLALSPMGTLARQPSGVLSTSSASAALLQLSGASGGAGSPRFHLGHQAGPSVPPYVAASASEQFSVPDFLVD